MTTYDDELCKKIEPAVCVTSKRFEALKQLRDAGIPTVVWLTPILPFINDTKENIEGLLNYCIEAKTKGIISFGMGLTLRDGNREYFYEQLNKNFPGLTERYIQTFGNRYENSSPNESELMQLLQTTCHAHNILCNNDAIFKYLNAFEEKNASTQLSLWDVMSIN